jgi:hypothetical protein
MQPFRGATARNKKQRQKYPAGERRRGELIFGSEAKESFWWKFALSRLPANIVVAEDLPQAKVSHSTPQQSVQDKLSPRAISISWSNVLLLGSALNDPDLLFICIRALNVVPRAGANAESRNTI